MGYANWVSRRQSLSKEQIVPRAIAFFRLVLKIADGYSDKPRAEKVLDAAVANVTHSMDSSHLALSVNAAVERGITNVMVIHDCFGAMAPDVELFAKVRRYELGKMYRDYNPLAQLGGTPPPRDPDFEIMAVCVSEYFDR